MLIGLKDLRIVPSKTQTIIESSYEFIADMIGDNIGKDGMKYLSFVFTLFLFILIGNLLGMFPYSFMDKSHYRNLCNFFFHFYRSNFDRNI